MKFLSGYQLLIVTAVSIAVSQADEEPCCLMRHPVKKGGIKLVKKGDDPFTLAPCWNGNQDCEQKYECLSEECDYEAECTAEDDGSGDCFEYGPCCITRVPDKNGFKLKEVSKGGFFYDVADLCDSEKCEQRRDCMKGEENCGYILKKCNGNEEEGVCFFEEDCGCGDDPPPPEEPCCFRKNPVSTGGIKLQQGETPDSYKVEECDKNTECFQKAKCNDKSDCQHEVECNDDDEDCFEWMPCCVERVAALQGVKLAGVKEGGFRYELCTQDPGGTCEQRVYCNPGETGCSKLKNCKSSELGKCFVEKECGCDDDPQPDPVCEGCKFMSSKIEMKEQSEVKKCIEKIKLKVKAQDGTCAAKDTTEMCKQDKPCKSQVSFGYAFKDEACAEFCLAYDVTLDPDQQNPVAFKEGAKKGTLKFDKESHACVCESTTKIIYIVCENQNGDLLDAKMYEYSYGCSECEMNLNPFDPTL